MLELEYLNCVPERHVDLSANSMLRRLAELAPYDSNCTVIIQQEGGDYLVRMEIVSHFGPFAASARSVDCQRALELVEHQISEQFAHWRRHRFDDEDRRSA